MLNEKKRWTAPPEMIIDPEKDYKAVFHTEKGDFTASNANSF